jgi:hypothetical protein
MVPLKIGALKGISLLFKGAGIVIVCNICVCVCFKRTLYLETPRNRACVAVKWHTGLFL